MRLLTLTIDLEDCDRGGILWIKLWSSGWISVKQGFSQVVQTTVHFPPCFRLQGMFLFKPRTFFLSPLSSGGLWFGVCMVIKSLMRPLETAVWGKQMASSRNLSVSFISLHFVCIQPPPPALICSSFLNATTIHITLRKKRKWKKKKSNTDNSLKTILPENK